MRLLETKPLSIATPADNTFLREQPLRFGPQNPHFILALNPIPGYGNLYVPNRVGCVEFSRPLFAEGIRTHSHIRRNHVEANVVHVGCSSHSSG